MTASPVRLAFDLGAGSGRVMSAGFDGEKIELREVHRFANTPVQVIDSLHWDATGLFNSILDGLTKAAATHGEIRSIGGDTWGVDYALIRSDGMPVGPVWNYRDPRNVAAYEAVLDEIGREPIFDATGLQFMPINTLFQLVAERRSGSGMLDAAESFLMMGDLFHYLLTGVRSVEATNASTTQLLDPRTRRWRTELMDRLDIPARLFADVTEPGTRLGELLPAIRTRTGMSATPVIAPATHDTASAVVAVPADNFAPDRPDWCYISSGTWSLVGVETAAPVINDACAAMNFTNEGGVGGSTRLLKNIGGMWVVQQIREAMRRRGDAPDWAAIVAMAESATPLSTLIDPDHPSLAAPGDMIDAVRTYVGTTGQPPIESDAAMFRACFDGLALRYRHTVRMIESLIASEIRTVHIVGGGSRNALLCQMTADACGKTVLAGPDEATAMGNVLMQMIGDGELGSMGQCREVVRASTAVVRYEPAGDADRWDEAAERFRWLTT